MIAKSFKEFIEITTNCIYFIITLFLWKLVEPNLIDQFYSNFAISLRNICLRIQKKMVLIIDKCINMKGSS